MEVLLARWQFAITIVYHWLFVPITLGLSVYIAILETIYVKTGKEVYLKAVKFWGKLFLINFAIGVVTGIVIEFQFGLNWAEYSRFVGDIFGAPLAVEALLAFFLESTFIGIWIFGWDTLSNKAHATTMWLVAIGSNLSAIWILIANSFMQEPMGYVINEVAGRAEMTSFFALIANPHVWYQFSHVFTSAIATAGFFVLGISAYHFWKGNNSNEMLQKSFKLAAVYTLIGTFLAAGIGHAQGQHMVQAQPMKMAAAEGLWETTESAPLSLFKICDVENQTDKWDISIPGLLSFMAYNDFTTPVKGIKNIQAESIVKYGSGNYIPPVNILFFTFRIMVGVGTLMLFLALFAVWKPDKIQSSPLLSKLFFLSLFLPFIAQATGWIFTEMGRLPWAVYGLLKVEDAASKAVSTTELIISLTLFTLLYTVLIFVDVYLMQKNSKNLDGTLVTPQTES